jgi:hypothetical protein
MEATFHDAAIPRVRVAFFVSCESEGDTLAFDWAGAAYGAAEARRQQQQDAQAAAEFELRRRALEAQLSAAEDARVARQEDRSRDADRQRMENARIVAGLLTPGGVSTEQASMLRGTPYGAALLEDKQTLPSRTGLGESQRIDPGGQPFTVFTGTAEQRQAAAQRAAREQVLRDPNLPPLVGRLVRLRDAGINLPNPESLETQAERDAEAARERKSDFADFTRRSDYTNKLILSRQRSTAAQTITAKDRLQARRWAQQDAADAYDALKDANGFVPEGMSLEQLTADLEAEYLGELDPSYRRPTPPVNTSQAMTNLQQVFPGGRAVGSRQTPLVGTLVPNPSAKTITRAELKATAQRLGITEQQAAVEARKRGLRVE